MGTAHVHIPTEVLETIVKEGIEYCDRLGYSSIERPLALGSYIAGRQAEYSRFVDQYQLRVHVWMIECFGETIAGDKMERNFRFLEEALELVQANGCTAKNAHALVDYVFGRDIGDLAQEIGGVMVTLAALVNAANLSTSKCGDIELRRCWENIDRIREKPAAKKIKSGPLP